MSHYFWNGLVVKHVDDGWYNISTKRVITKCDRKDLCYLNTINICGTPDDIEKFKLENKVLFPQSSSSSQPCSSSQSTKSITQKLMGIFKKDEICTTDPLTKEEKDCMRPFVFNFSGKGEIIDVVDGDTYNMLVFVPLKELEKEVSTVRNKEKKKPIITRGDKNSGFYTIFPCRLYGIDAAEKNTYEGQFAKEKMVEFFKQNNNNVYFIMRNIPKGDCDGRQLMEIYLDENLSKSCARYLLELRYNGNAVALPYDGKTKSDYMKNLPTIRGFEITENDEDE